MDDLENAPWESIGELQAILGDGIEGSLDFFEDDDRWEDFDEQEGGLEREELQQHLQHLQGSIDEMRQGLESKQEHFDESAHLQLGALFEAMQNDGSGKEAIEAQREAYQMAVESQMEAAVRGRDAMQRVEEARELVDTAEMRRLSDFVRSAADDRVEQTEFLEALELLKRGQAASSENSERAMEHAHLQMEQVREQMEKARETYRSEYENARSQMENVQRQSEQKRALEMAAERQSAAELATLGADDERLRLMANRLENDQVEIQSRNQQLSELQKAIAMLRDEVRQLREEQDRDDD